LCRFVFKTWCIMIWPDAGIRLMLLNIIGLFLTKIYIILKTVLVVIKKLYAMAYESHSYIHRNIMTFFIAKICRQTR
jgi:hypothetical protein